MLLKNIRLAKFKNVLLNLILNLRIYEASLKPLTNFAKYSYLSSSELKKFILHSVEFFLFISTFVDNRLEWVFKKDEMPIRNYL